MNPEMKALDELVNGSDGWVDTGHGEYEKPIMTGRRAWWKRCCGLRMLVIYRAYRDAEAFKRTYPAGSRALRVRLGSRSGYECSQCGYQEKYDSPNGPPW